MAVREKVRPFLKWAGGKRQMMPALERYVPREHGRYFEPFLGGGALFFHLRPKRAALSDSNARLVRTYRGVRDDVDAVVALLRSYPHDRAFFQRMRETPIDDRSDAEVAAWLIYLNKTAYNGLYRVNRQDRFNVPFGRYVNPSICDEKVLRACSKALRGSRIDVHDFARIEARAKAGDFVYFDPPYVPLSRTSSFTSYTASEFDDAQQERLRDVALRLKRKGVFVMVSNSSAAKVRELYARGFSIEEVPATRMVNSNASGRGAVVELVMT